MIGGLVKKIWSEIFWLNCKKSGLYPFDAQKLTFS